MDTETRLQESWDALAALGVDEPEQLRCYHILEKLCDEDLADYLDDLLAHIARNGLVYYVDGDVWVV